MAMLTVADLLVTAPIPGTHDDQTTLLGSLLHAMGASMETEAEDVALLSATDIAKIKDTWRVQPGDDLNAQAREPTPLEAVKLDTLVKRARAATASRSAEEAVVVAANIQSSAAAAVAAPPKPKKSVTMAEVMNQSDSTEVVLVPNVIIELMDNF